VEFARYPSLKEMVVFVTEGASGIATFLIAGLAGLTK
jgi:hypothetical protein